MSNPLNKPIKVYLTDSAGYGEDASIETFKIVRKFYFWEFEIEVGDAWGEILLAARQYETSVFGDKYCGACGGEWPRLYQGWLRGIKQESVGASLELTAYCEFDAYVKERHSWGRKIIVDYRENRS